MLAAAATQPWSVNTYPDEAGFLRRTAPTLRALAKIDFAARSKASSTCPDTGLPVKTWACAGETIISPYTGRLYRQGDTGYFGPKARDEQGRIVAFGGDPLKYDLPPATARLLLSGDDAEAKAFLSIPGHMRQQYHFAAVNWCRFYPLLAERMGPAWKKDFAHWVGAYREQRKPSDGDREHTAKSVHDLVGVENELLGGDVVDGGTENHKTQWRTSGLLYSQILGDSVTISGYKTADAERITSKVIRQYLQTSWRVGNGEWDSSTYYPHTIRGFFNLYDFSPDPKTRAMAQAALDFYIASYGLKVMNGTFIGAQKRGWVGGPELKEMDTLLWMFAPGTTYAVPPNATTIIHQATTRYRPNQVICNLITKNVPLPFEAQMARPTYHSKDRNAFQETFWCDQGLAMGSVAMTMVDNPTQQTIWSLGVRSEHGAMIFGGSQPRYRHPEGHSPYDQIIQKRGALILLTGQTAMPEGERTAIQEQRAKNAADRLVELPRELSPEQRFAKAKTAAETWLYIPRQTKVVQDRDDLVVIDAGDAWVIARPIGAGHLWLDAPETKDKDLAKISARYRILVATGSPSGFAVDTVLKKAAPTEEALREVLKKTSLDVSRVAEGVVGYTSAAGDTIEMHYQ